MSSWAGLEYLYVLTCKGLRIAAVRHLKNAGGPAGLGPRVRGRKWCHAVHCCPVLFVWQPYCTEGLPTGWELMGLALHTLFPRPHWSAHNFGSQCLVRGKSRGPWRGSRDPQQDEKRFMFSLARKHVGGITRSSKFTVFNNLQKRVQIRWDKY